MGYFPIFLCNLIGRAGRLSGLSLRFAFFIDRHVKGNQQLATFRLGGV
jgi:hypothetical protein